MPDLFVKLRECQSTMTVTVDQTKPLAQSGQPSALIQQLGTAGWSIADVNETVDKILKPRQWFRKPGKHCIDSRDHLSPRVAL